MPCAFILLGFKALGMFLYISSPFFLLIMVMYSCPLKQDSKAQITALHLIIGTLQRMSTFGVENRDTLTHKTTGVIFFIFAFC